eukprot:357931-Chlamydomonas_euryale.AAC.4
MDGCVDGCVNGYVDGRAGRAGAELHHPHRDVGLDQGQARDPGRGAGKGMGPSITQPRPIHKAGQAGQLQGVQQNNAKAKIALIRRRAYGAGHRAPQAAPPRGACLACAAWGLCRMHHHGACVACTTTGLVSHAPPRRLCRMRQHGACVACTNTRLLSHAPTRGLCRMHQHKASVACTNTGLVSHASTRAARRAAAMPVQP